jgi:hypothetical protein
LTAYVDGVLSPRRRKTVLRLLEKSAEARSILQQLQENAKKLQDLPHHQLSPDFPAHLMGQIESLKPPVSPVPAAAGYIPTWMGVTAAAAVLFLVALGSYFFFHSKEVNPIGPLAKDKTIDPTIARILEGTAQQFAKEIGTRITLADLNQEQPRALLDGELKKSAAVHVDLACKNGIQAVERLSSVLKGNGIKVLEDAKVRTKSGTGQGKAILVYAENIRPDELGAILRQLGQKDGNKEFDTVLVDALTDGDRHDVAKLLGVNVKQLQPSPRGTDLPTFIEAPPKPKGKNSGAENPPRQPERFALVLPMANGSNPASSAAIQDFLRSRMNNPLRPGTLQVVVVLHPTA